MEERYRDSKADALSTRIGMSTLAIVAARWGSTRLPGKVLEQIGEWTALEHCVRRVQAAVPNVVVAIPNGPKDARIAMYCRDKLRVPCFLWDGPENDVLGRFVACARDRQADVVVRVTPDCPFVDPQMIGLLVMLQQSSGCPYVCNLPLPRPQVDGLDCEVFTRELLEETQYRRPTRAEVREHVSSLMRWTAQWHLVLDRPLNLHDQRIMGKPFGQDRWTLDTPADLAWFREIAKRIDVTPPRAVTWDLVELLNAEPQLRRYA